MTEVETMAGNITKNGGQPGCIKKEKSQDPIGRSLLNRRLYQGKLEEEGEGFALFNSNSIMTDMPITLAVEAISVLRAYSAISDSNLIWSLWPHQPR